MKAKAIVYLNQFFGQVGGEDKAAMPPEIRMEPVGPADQLNNLLQNAEVTATIICGDNYMGEHREEALKTIEELLSSAEFDILIAGPAFQAGRYGVACGNVCKMVKERFNKPVITSMHEESPGVDLFRNDFRILRGGNSAAAIRKDLPRLASFADRLISKDMIGSADQEGYFSTGRRHQIWLDPPVPASRRAVDMLVKKATAQPYKTELPIILPENVPIAKPVADMKNACLAIVTSGGVVPVSNPDKIQSASATRWGRYDMTNMARLEAGVFKTIHAGFDPTVCNLDPNVIVPLDALRELESEGRIGSVHNYFYSTVGTGTTLSEASRMASEIGQQLLKAEVSAAILVSA